MLYEEEEAFVRVVGQELFEGIDCEQRSVITEKTASHLEHTSAVLEAGEVHQHDGGFRHAGLLGCEGCVHPIHEPLEEVRVPVARSDLHVTAIASVPSC